ncbi:MAG: hypothetical protein ACRC2R_16955 [Xenococcaceae cyanobacterium]
MAEITKVSYSKLTNLGNYSNERIELEAIVKDGENWEEVLEDLRAKVSSKTKGVEEYRNLRDEIWKFERELEELIAKTEKARATWETVSTFMKAQGINTDPAMFPDLPALTGTQEDAEIVDEDEDYEKENENF